MKKRFCLSVILSLSGVIAFGNQIHYAPIDLAELVKMSDAILVVKKDADFEKVLKIPVVCESGEKKNSFSSLIHRFTVTEELKNTTGETCTGRSIEVRQAHEDSGYLLQKKYDCEKIAKSPIYRRYNSKSEIHAADNLIIFLRKSAKGFSYAVEHAHDSVALKEAIRSEISKSK